VLFLKFVHGQLNYFNETILRLEKGNASAVDVADILLELKLHLREWKEKPSSPLKRSHTGL